MERSWGDSGVGLEILPEELPEHPEGSEGEVLGRYGWRSRAEYLRIVESLVLVLTSPKVRLHRKTRRRLRNRLRSMLGIDRRLRKNRKVPHYKVRRMKERRWKAAQRERGGGYTTWDLKYYTRIKLPLHKAGLRKFKKGELVGLSKYLYQPPSHPPKGER